VQLNTINWWKYHNKLLFTGRQSKVDHATLQICTQKPQRNSIKNPTLMQHLLSLNGLTISVTETNRKKELELEN